MNHIFNKSFPIFYNAFKIIHHLVYLYAKTETTQIPKMVETSQIHFVPQINRISFYM